MKQALLYKILWIASIILLGISVATGDAALIRMGAVATAITLVLVLGTKESLKGYRYTACIIAAVVAGMCYPQYFTNWGSIQLRDKTLLLVIVQLVMFGMGTHMSWRDFQNVKSTGKGVLVGLIGHFTIMPLMAVLLTSIFHFDAEIAAGIILIGSCSSGLASNVMTYLARANLVLSVIVTAMATLVAPLLTPLLMKLFAGTLIEVRFTAMMMEIIKIVLVPIGAALLHDVLKTATGKNRNIIHRVVLVSAVWLLAVLLLQQRFTGGSGDAIILSGFFAGAVVAGWTYHQLYRYFPRIDQVMPVISMFGIIYFTTVTTAAGRDNLLKVGWLLVVVSVLHNAAGYFFGYWFSRIMGLDKRSSRSVAFEVGLQNGGMASGISGSMGKLGTVGLAAAVFSPWMNISGSLLANYWKSKALKEEKQEAASQ